MKMEIFFKIIIPIITAFFGALIDRFFTDKVKLLTYFGHAASVRMKQVQDDGSPLIVNTHAIYIQNNGRKAAKKVKVGHNSLPDFQIFPPKKYESSLLPDGSIEIEIENILPKEIVVINYIYFPPILYNQINTYVTSDEGYAKVVNVQLTKQYSKYFQILVWFFLSVGISTILYFAYILFNYLLTVV